MKIVDTDGCIELNRSNERVFETRQRTLDEVTTTRIPACELAYGAAKRAKADQTVSLYFVLG